MGSCQSFLYKTVTRSEDARTSVVAVAALWVQVRRLRRPSRTHKGSSSIFGDAGIACQCGGNRGQESEIKVATMSTATTADINMCTIVEGVRRYVQAQLEQNRVDIRHCEEKTQHKVDQIAEQLQELTK